MDIIFWKWVVGILLVLSTIATISLIGVPRQPISRNSAIVNTLVNGAILYWLISL